MIPIICNGGGGTSNSTIMLFCGNKTPSQAPFSVSRSGVVSANAMGIGNIEIAPPSVRIPNGVVDIKGNIRGVAINGNDAFNDVTALISLKAGSSKGATQSAARRWIEGNHSQGWGSGFFIESRYLGDANSMERTIIAADHLMTHQQLYNMVGQSNTELYPVYYDARSGFFVMKYN